MKRILLLGVILLLAGVVTAEDCATCTATKICDTHAASDKEAIKALRDGLAKADPADRIAAIEAFATSCAAHANCRPATNAQVLAAAMKDPDGMVRGKAAQRLGAQDPKTAGPILAKEAEPLNKKLEKDPKGPKEEAEWLANFDEMTGICKGLAIMGTQEAGPAMATILTSTRLKVLNVAYEAVPGVRASAVPPAMISAIDRVRFSKPSPDRNATWIEGMKAWEALTDSKVQRPDPASAADAIRYVTDLKTWWKTNEKTWK